MYGRRKARVLLAVLILVAFILVTVDFRTGGEDRDGPLDRLRGAVTAVVRPIQAGVSTLVRPVGEAVGGVTDVFTVRAENQRLRARLETLEERRRSATDLERENAELRQLLALRDRAQLDTVAATTVALGATNFEWTITLDVGTSDGVQRNMPVINGDGLVGRILDATSSASTVLLTIDPNFSAPVRTSVTGETGIITGRGGEPLAFSPLDPEAALEVGQELVTSAYEGGLYPPGIPIGTIADVGRSTTALTREVSVRPFVDFTRLHHVLVIVNAPVEPLPPFTDPDDLGFVRPDVDTFVRPEDLDADDPDGEVEGEGGDDDDEGDDA